MANRPVPRDYPGGDLRPVVPHVMGVGHVVVMEHTLCRARRLGHALAHAGHEITRVHLHGDKDQAEDQPRQHREGPINMPAPKPTVSLDDDDATPPRFGEERRGHCLVPVLTGDYENAEDKGEKPRVVEHREDVGEPLGRAVRDYARPRRRGVPRGRRRGAAPKSQSRTTTIPKTTKVDQIVQSFCTSALRSPITAGLGPPRVVAGIRGENA